MKYVIRIAALARDKLTLYHIAHAIAHDAATAGDTPFQKETYEGILLAQAKQLLADAESGRLRVCDQYGSPVKAAEFLASCNADGFGVEVLDESGQQRNQELTAILALHTKATWAQEWAAWRGDEIAVISDGEWIDRRGVVRPAVIARTTARAPAANDGDEPNSRPITDMPAGQPDSTGAQSTAAEPVQTTTRQPVDPAAEEGVVVHTLQRPSKSRHYWHLALEHHFPGWQRESGSRIRAKEVIRRLAGLGDPRLGSKEYDTKLTWRTNDGDWESVGEHTVSNKISLIRQALRESSAESPQGREPE